MAMDFKRGWMKKIILIFSLWFLYQGISGLWALFRLVQEKKHLEREINVLKAKIAVLERERNFLSSREGIETLARLKLGMKRENEKIIHIMFDTKFEEEIDKNLTE
jgi:cell division protein FtsB